MEYLRGHDLGEVVRASGPLHVTDAVDYVLQACEAIAEAHTLGIVHRDLKPANLFLTRRPDGTGFVKVIDFGISKATQDAGSLGQSGGMTATTAMLGSPRYMSPEQIRSTKNVDHRTDIWALGVVLFEILTARPVYLAETLAGLIAMIGADPPTSLRSVRENVPVELERIIARCLEKDPARRFAHIGELAVALAQIGDHRAKASADRTVGVLRAAGMLSVGGGTLTATPENLAIASARTDRDAVSTRPEGDAAPARTDRASAAGGTSAAWGATGTGRARSVGTIAMIAAAVVTSASLVAVVVMRGMHGGDAALAVATSPPVATSAAGSTDEHPPAPPATAPTTVPLAALPPAITTPPALVPAAAPSAAPAAPVLVEHKALPPRPTSGGDGGLLRSPAAGASASSSHHGPTPTDRGDDPY